MILPEAPAEGCAWITGASSGMGLGMAERLAAAGWKVAISARGEDRLREAASGHDGRIMPFTLDVTDEDAAEALVPEIEKELGPVRLAIMNAGAYKPVTAEEFDAGEVRRQMAVNYFGAVNCIGAVLPGMLERRAGHLALVASPTSYRGLPRAGAYGAAKSAMVSLAESLKFDLDRAGVDISVILPGFVRTPMTEQNDFEMPFLMEPDEAVSIILDGLARKHFEVAFPRRLVWPLKLFRMLPYRLYYPLMRKVTGL
jgi:NAD(P)-dependent dehydrogenase (short-subunit alcohol dehydrogenase family)